MSVAVSSFPQVRLSFRRDKILVPVSSNYSSKRLVGVENKNIARALWLLGKIGGVTDGLRCDADHLSTRKVEAPITWVGCPIIGHSQASQRAIKDLNNGVGW